MLGLNVFGDNDAAQSLYRRAGYRVTSSQMRKSLGQSVVRGEQHDEWRE